MTKQRCPWCLSDPIYTQYHDEEWGVPQHNERVLFEFLILEGAQAGLSWLTVLKKRPHYRKIFDGFDPAKIARYDKKKFAALMADAGIIRNRLKIESTIDNAKIYLKLLEKEGGLDPFLWKFVSGRPIRNRWASMKQIPTRTPESDAMSKSLKQLGFRFVGSTICYAFMQACGLVDDHLTDCYRHGAKIRT